MGHDVYEGGASDYYSFAENADNLKMTYAFSQGYFGNKGDSKSNSIRHIESDDPLSSAQSFYDMAAYGGMEESLGPGKWKATMEDGTVITMRETSTSDGSPVVDINIEKGSDSKNIKSQKIHFTKRKENLNG